MSRIRISVCIPVYNCAAFLPAALESILDQVDESVEVVVFDGGSTDETPQLMEAYSRRRGVHYHRAASRGGIDADMATCVSHAVGDYCWLFSGDDVMRPGALRRAAEWLAGEPDAVLCRHTICDIGMRHLFEHRVLFTTDPVHADFADAQQRLAWFRSAASTEAFFSFMSGIIVRRQTWNRGRMHDEFARSCWAHVVRLLALGPQGLRLIHVPEIWLDQRGENDSFVGAGVVNRYRIAIEGYQRIATYLYGSASEEAFHIRRVLRLEFTLRMFLNAKVLCREDPARESRQLLDVLYAQLHIDHSPRSRWLLALYGLIPGWMAALMRQGVRALRRLTGAGASPQPLADP
jgi:abequosyltransferase